MKALGIEFAPLNIPMDRRMQTFAVLVFVMIFLQALSLFGYFMFVYLLFTRFYWVSLAYAMWYYLDRNRCHEGGRYSHWVRSWKFWKHFKEYFPIELVKTADLDPSKNYIFGISPHGVMCFSSMANFATEGTGFSAKFPGLTSHLITLNGQFKSPLMREFFMLTGACCAEETGLKYILGNQGRWKSKGQVCAILVGGARESIESYPDKYRLVLNRRKGFIRVALQTGASLVPVISFGENNAYMTVQTPKGSLLRNIQEKILQWFLIGAPVLLGRGIFNYTIGILPFRTPIYTVVGSPIDVEKCENPSKEQIEKLHAIYKQELIKLFDDNKEKYSKNKNIELEIIN